MTRNWPVDREYPITSGWGERWGVLHDGMDLGTPEGTPIFSCHAGRVYNRSWDAGGYGNWVEIIGDDGYTTQYGHLSQINVVPTGVWQPRGTLIAYSGNTGGSTGPHLHLRVKWTGQARGFDPYPWLDGKPYAKATSGGETDGALAHTVEGKVYRWAKAHGLSDAGAAGLLGNLEQESRVWSDAIECNGQVGRISLEQALALIVPGRCEGMGILQWSFDRRHALIAYARSTSREWWDLEMQLDFMLTEIHSNPRYVAMWDRLEAATDPVVAAKDLDDVFIRSGIKGERFNYARQHFDRIARGDYNLAGGVPARFPTAYKSVPAFI